MNKVALIVFLIIGSAFFAGKANAQPTTFTYQGSLNNAGAPANGSFDFEFALYDLASAGSQLGSTFVINNVLATNGIFAVSLNFGAQFPGGDRFLEIRVRPAGSGTFTTLVPRQQVHSSPYSIKSLNAENAANATTATTATNSLNLGGISAGQYVLTGDARLTDARNPLPGSANYIQNQNAAPQANTSFFISGNGTLNGTLQASIVRAQSQFNLGSERVLRASTCVDNTYLGIGAGESNIGCAASGNRNSFFGANAGRDNTGATGSNQHNSFFGANSGDVNTLGFQNSFFGSDSGGSNTTGDDNTFFGKSAGITNTNGNKNTVIGSTADVASSGLSNATAIGAYAQVSQSNSMVLGSINGVNGATADTRVGIGTTAPEKEFHVRGTGDQEIMIESSDIGGLKWTLQASAGSAGGRFAIIDRTANTNRLTILGDGFVGIGTPAPVQRLDVTGNVRIGTGTTGCVEDRDGTVIAGTCSSDMRFKRDVTSLSSVLTNFSKLRPVNFYWRRDEFAHKHFGINQSFGLIAQEVEQLFPELVSTDEQGFKVVNYSKLPLLTIQAVKEQQAQIESLQKQIREQAAIIEEQRTTIPFLKAAVCELKPELELCERKEK